MSFYQEFWETIKDDLFAFFSDFYQDGEISKGINATFLTLIPKKVGASVANDFRPISLISGPYKTIAEVLDEAIDGNQFFFVKDRNMMDCIMIVNESVEDNRHGKKRGLILKLYLDKAYDYTN